MGFLWSKYFRKSTKFFKILLHVVRLRTRLTGVQPKADWSWKALPCSIKFLYCGLKQWESHKSMQQYCQRKSICKDKTYFTGGYTQCKAVIKRVLCISRLDGNMQFMHRLTETQSILLLWAEQQWSMCISQSDLIAVSNNW